MKLCQTFCAQLKQQDFIYIILFEFDITWPLSSLPEMWSTDTYWSFVYASHNLSLHTTPAIRSSIICHVRLGWQLIGRVHMKVLTNTRQIANANNTVGLDDVCPSLEYSAPLATNSFSHFFLLNETCVIWAPVMMCKLLRSLLLGKRLRRNDS